jgi:hypothetical protein
MVVSLSLIVSILEVLSIINGILDGTQEFEEVKVIAERLLRVEIDAQEQIAN